MCIWDRSFSITLKIRWFGWRPSSRLVGFSYVGELWLGLRLAMIRFGARIGGSFSLSGSLCSQGLGTVSMPGVDSLVTLAWEDGFREVGWE